MLVAERAITVGWVQLEPSCFGHDEFTEDGEWVDIGSDEVRRPRRIRRIRSRSS